MSGAFLSHLLPPLPGFTVLARTYAPWPVWSGSTTKPVQFAAMPKKQAVKLWHRARDFDRTINAEAWEPMPGMVKRPCPECRYWFATATGTGLCADCARPRRGPRE
jgi:hypothetical protein